MDGAATNYDLLFGLCDLGVQSSDNIIAVLGVDCEKRVKSLEGGFEYGLPGAKLKMEGSGPLIGVNPWFDFIHFGQVTVIVKREDCPDEFLCDVSHIVSLIFCGVQYLEPRRDFRALFISFRCFLVPCRRHSVMVSWVGSPSRTMLC